MNKKLILIVLLSPFVFFSCGFSPVLKNINNDNLKIKSIKITGETTLVFFLQGQLNFKENLQDPDALNIKIDIKKNISSKTKNTSGITTEENLEVILTLKIYDNNDKNNIYDDEFSSTKTIKLSSNPVTDEELKKVETENILKDMSQKIKFLINYVVNKK